jgi:hypothetical protein
VKKILSTSVVIDGEHIGGPADQYEEQQKPLSYKMQELNAKVLNP